MLHFIFSPLIFSTIVMLKFYTLFKRLRLKCKELSDGKVVSLTKKEFGFAANFLKAS